MDGFMRLIGRLVFWAGLLGALGIAAAGLGYRFNLWDVRTALVTVMPYATYVALGAVAVGVLWVIVSFFRSNRAGIGGVVVGVIVAAAAGYFPIKFRMDAQAVPAIHDISTDTANPPVFVAVAPLRAADPKAKNPTEYAGAETAAKQAEAYPDLKTYRSTLTSDQLYAKALAAAREMGWEIVAEVPGEGRIEATDTTLWFGFKDDVVIRIAADGAGSILDIRSKSRVGSSDVGVNAKRIRAFIAKLG